MVWPQFEGSGGGLVDAGSRRHPGMNGFRFRRSCASGSLAFRSTELRMDLAQCPYDSSPLESEPHANGSTLLWCPTCGAAWEWYRAWRRRLREPDREAVLAARAGRSPERVMRAGVPDPARVSTMWWRVRP